MTIEDIPNQVIAVNLPKLDEETPFFWRDYRKEKPKEGQVILVTYNGGRFYQRVYKDYLSRLWEGDKTSLPRFRYWVPIEDISLAGILND